MVFCILVPHLPAGQLSDQEAVPASVESVRIGRVPRLAEIPSKKLGADSSHLDQGDAGPTGSSVRGAFRAALFRVSLNMS